MQSGDGMIVRVRPRLSQISAAQAKGLARLARQYGNGQIDLTNRANLQLLLAETLMCGNSPSLRAVYSRNDSWLAVSPTQAER